MPLQSTDAVVPTAPIHVLPAQVVDVPVVLRRLPDRQLQQRQILAPGLFRVRVVVQLDAFRSDHGTGAALPHPLQHLVDRMHPLIAPTGVDFLVPKDHPLGAVGVEGPGVPVGRLSRPRRPYLLQLLPPAGMEHLVQVGADADVRVLRRQLQRAVPCGIEAPGGDGLHRHLGPPLPQLFHRTVLGARVQHHHPVGLGHGVHPAFYKLLFVFANGVDTYLVPPHKNLL